MLEYQYYFLLQNPNMASVYYDLAGVVAIRTGVSEMGWLRNLARKLRIDAQNPEIMLPILEKMYREEPDPALRQRYRKRYIEGLRKRNILYLQAETDRFNKDYGFYPRNLEELVNARYINLVPPDVERGTYQLDGAKVKWKP